MDPLVSDDVEQLLSRAQEARAVALLITNPESKLMMLRIARCYEQLASITKPGAPATDTPGKERGSG